ncbi:MAG: hypothetical protein K2G44_03100 [Clostridia bacterium]|nr:hypothetical protein [Clostridia bacterium]
MRIVFGSTKYLIKNIWYVLPYAILPAVFFTLLLDYASLSDLLTGFFTGAPKSDFLLNFRALSLLKIDLLGGMYTLCAFICFVIFGTLLLTVVEKHMRLGKRTPSGALSQFANLLLSVLGFALAYFIMYEVWVVALSAVLFAISAIRNAIVVCILQALAFVLFTLVLLYLSTISYLWLPCKQMTGFGNFAAFIYSYRLMATIRGKLLVSFGIFFTAIAAIITGMTFLPEIAFRIVSFFVFLFAFLDFGIRMETAYFTADKLDREDLIRSYREL